MKTIQVNNNKAYMPPISEKEQSTQYGSDTERIYYRGSSQRKMPFPIELIRKK